MLLVGRLRPLGRCKVPELGELRKGASGAPPHALRLGSSNTLNNSGLCVYVDFTPLRTLGTVLLRRSWLLCCPPRSQAA